MDKARESAARRVPVHAPSSPLMGSKASARSVNPERPLLVPADVRAKKGLIHYNTGSSTIEERIATRVDCSRSASFVHAKGCAVLFIILLSDKRALETEVPSIRAGKSEPEKVSPLGVHVGQGLLGIGSEDWSHGIHMRSEVG